MHSVFILFILVINQRVQCKNYTQIQQEEFRELSPDVQLRYAKLYGDEKILRQVDAVKVEKWIYPTSSTFDLKILYEGENSLLRSLKQLSKLINDKIIATRSKHVQLLAVIKRIVLPPDKMFYEGAGLGIIQIQGHSNATIGDIVVGDVLGYKSPHSLSSWDCHQLSISAMNLGRLDLQIDWLAKAVKMETNKNKQKVLKSKLTNFKAFHDEILLEQGFSIDPENITELKAVERGTMVVTKNTPALKINKDNPLVKEHWQKVMEGTFLRDLMGKNNVTAYFFHHHTQHIKTYNMLFRQTNIMRNLCAGNSDRSPELDRDVKCHHHFRSDPYLQLGPFKLENLNSQPHIGLIHQFISTKEADWVIETNGPHLIPTPYTVQGASLTFSRKRTSKIRYMRDRAGEPPAALTKRLHLASPYKLLTPWAQENYQVMNYGPGGIIGCHTDELPSWLSFQNQSWYDEGDQLTWNLGGMRLATAMIYVKSALAGGRTVFPMLLLSVPPTPQALLFWHNITPDHFPDTRALHAACPVIIGDKWIMNKWINISPHWDTHKCGMKRSLQGAFPMWKSN